MEVESLIKDDNNVNIINKYLSRNLPDQEYALKLLNISKENKTSNIENLLKRYMKYIDHSSKKIGGSSEYVINNYFSNMFQNIKNLEENYRLHNAVSNSDIEQVKMLLENGEDPNIWMKMVNHQFFTWNLIQILKFMNYYFCMV